VRHLGPRTPTWSSHRVQRRIALLQAVPLSQRLSCGPRRLANQEPSGSSMATTPYPLQELDRRLELFENRPVNQRSANGDGPVRCAFALSYPIVTSIPPPPDCCRPAAIAEHHRNRGRRGLRFRKALIFTEHPARPGRGVTTTGTLPSNPFRSSAWRWCRRELGHDQAADVRHGRSVSQPVPSGQGVRHPRPVSVGRLVLGVGTGLPAR